MDNSRVKFNKVKTTLSSVLLFFFIGNLYSQSIQRIEPPFWWTDMNNPNIQLLVYGEGISSLQPQTQSNDLKITKVHKAESENYIFIDVTISEKAIAGNQNIEFYKNDQLIETYNFELKTRKKNSANRKGFDNSDLLYLITPDRFANGDPSNDVISGMREGLNRKEDFGRHGGDIQGLIDHLDYFKEMGYTALWLNPILENDQDKWSYHGYSTTDYYKVDPRFGSNEDYLNLSNKAREKGIGIIMDIIVNHCGHFHWWMEDPPFPNWINNQEGEYQQTNHRKTTLLDPYASTSDRRIMTEGWFVPTMPDLNQRNKFMSTYLIQNSIWWIEYADLAGIRQDTYSYPFREFMTDWTCAIKDEYPNFNIVGEEWVDDASIISYWQEDKVNSDGYSSCLPSLMDFPTTFALHKALNEEEIWGKGWVKLYENLANDYLYSHPNNLVIFGDNHDMSRIYTQLNEDYDLYKMAMAYILTMRGIPQVYYGTEILMSNKGTESHGVIRSDFPGGWSQDSSSVRLHKNLSAQQKEALEFNKKLNHWRKEKEVIHTGKLVHFEPQDKVYCYLRFNDEEKVMVILNKNKEAFSLELTRFNEILDPNSKGKEVLTDQEIQLKNTLELEPMRAYIIEIK